MRRISRYTLDIFLHRAKSIHGTKYNYLNIKDFHIKNVMSKIPISCLTCDYNWSPTIHHHINHESGCPSCTKTLPWNSRRFLATAYELHGTRYNYHITNMTNKHSVIEIYCTLCNNTWSCSINNHIYKKSGCPHCNMTIGENAVYNALIQMNIVPNLQKILPTLPNRRYDFYFIYQNKEYLVEYDGQQHFQYTPFFHNNQTTFKKRQNDDIMKTNHALKQGYNLIRIDYTQLNNISFHLNCALSSQDRLYLSTPIIYEYCLIE